MKLRARPAIAALASTASSAEIWSSAEKTGRADEPLQVGRVVEQVPEAGEVGRDRIDGAGFLASSKSAVA